MFFFHFCFVCKLKIIPDLLCLLIVLNGMVKGNVSRIFIGIFYKECDFLIFTTSKQFWYNYFPLYNLLTISPLLAVEHFMKVSWICELTSVENIGATFGQTADLRVQQLRNETQDVYLWVNDFSFVPDNLQEIVNWNDLWKVLELISEIIFL